MKPQKNIAETLAEQSTIHVQTQSTHPRTDPLPPIPLSTPAVFPGDITQTYSPLAGHGPNRKIRRRKVSPFNIMILLIGGAVAIVLYIGNIIAVNELLAEINLLQAQLQQIQMDQELLRAQMNKLASLERIQQIAEADLGLRSLREPPAWLPVDQEKIKEIEESSKVRGHQ